MPALSKLNNKGIAHILLLVLLLGGIVAGVYLVQHQQIFKPKATGEKIEWIKPDSPDPDNCIIDNGTAICPKVKFRINVPVEVPQ